MFTAWGCRLAHLANLAPAEVMQRRLATIESMALDAAHGAYPSIAQTALVAGILREEGRIHPDLPEARLVSLDAIRPLQSIIDLYTNAAAVDREPLMVRLRTITRSKPELMSAIETGAKASVRNADDDIARRAAR